jgi:hypothetical protein
MLVYRLLAAFFKKIKLRRTIEEIVLILEISPNNNEVIYKKMIAYLMWKKVFPFVVSWLRGGITEVVWG